MNPQASILLVEDEEMLRGLIQELLESKGYAVHGAASGEEALALFERPGRGFDLVLTDVMMPHMNGPELVDRIRARDAKVKVIFMSGYTGSSSPSIQNSLSLPGVAFLQKPFRLQSLIEEVESLLK